MPQIASTRIASHLCGNFPTELRKNKQEFFSLWLVALEDEITINVNRSGWQFKSNTLVQKTHTN